ncbi:MAG: hypothetical protein ACREJD_09530 [Phycisphaerales bacterium]
MNKRDDKPKLAINYLEQFAPKGVVASMDGPALGAFVLLLQNSWTEEPPCSLPHDETHLAFIARTRDWAQVRPALLAVWKPDPSGRLLNSQAREIYDALAAEVAAFSEKQRRASNARWAKESGPNMPRDPGGMPVASRRDSGGIPVASSGRSAPSLRSESLHALLPQRSNEQNESERSAGRGEVIGMVGEGARAHEARLLQDWRITQIHRLAGQAMERWRAAGICKAPTSKAREISLAEKLKPAIVATAIHLVDEKAKAESALGRRDFNAFGYFVALLGLSEKTAHRGPIEPLLHIASHWSEQREKIMPAIRAQAAIDSRRQMNEPSATAQAGGA